jgi:hypothetical protein
MVVPLHSVARADGNTAGTLDILIIRPTGVDADEERWTGLLLASVAWIRQASGNDVAWFDMAGQGLQPLGAGPWGDHHRVAP